MVPSLRRGDAERRPAVCDRARCESCGWMGLLFPHNDGKRWRRRLYRTAAVPGVLCRDVHFAGGAIVNLYVGDSWEFRAHGLTFRATVEHDDSMRPPWEEHDGHGPVREIRENRCTGEPDKRPGERVLVFDRGAGYAYDWQEAVAIARRDGWGIAPERRAEWEARIGRKLTAGQIAEAAVRDDFERMRGWLSDDWCWIGIVVTLLDADGDPVRGWSDSLWGIESDCGKEYGEQVAAELAREIASRVGRRKTVDAGAARVLVR